MGKDGPPADEWERVGHPPCPQAAPEWDKSRGTSRLSPGSPQVPTRFPQSPFMISVYVWASTHICGDLWCDEHGNFIGPAPREIRGMHPTNVEFDLLLGGFYILRINSNPFLRIGPGYVKVVERFCASSPVVRVSVGGSIFGMALRGLGRR